MAELLAAIEPPPRRWPYVAVAAGVVIAAVTTTAFLSRGGSAPDPLATCRPTESMLADIWNPTKRSVLTGALRARGTAPDAVTELDRRLDLYATGWTTARRDACLVEVAGRTAPELVEGRLACLETRKAAFDVVVTSLIEQDADVFASWKRVTSLSPVEACASDEAARLSPGTIEHQSLMRALAVAMTKDRPAIGAVGERAKIAHDLPAQLEILLTHATAAMNDRALTEADDALAQARPLAERLDAQSTRVRAFALSARSLCLQNRNAEAATFLTMAEAGAQRLRETEHAAEIDEVLHAGAECHYRTGEMALALPQYLTLIERVQRQFGRESLDEYELRTRLGQIYVALDRMDDAKRESDTWQAIWWRFNPAAPTTGEQEDRLSMEALQAGDLDGAIEHGRRSVEAFAATRDPNLPVALVGLAMLYEVAAESKVSAATYGQALDLIPATTEDEELAVKRVEALDGRGQMRLLSGDLDGAVTDLEAAIAGGTRWHQAYYVASAEVGLGRAWVEKREYARGLRALRRSVATYAKLNDASPFRIATGQFALAQAQWETSDPTGARATAALAETSAALALERAQSPLGRRLVPRCTTLLATIEHWRDTLR
jgi:tetratricopeptide (TPR) repeat protein